MDYIKRKIAHMQRNGISAGTGKYGGACPDWLRQQREAEEKRNGSKNRKNEEDEVITGIEL